MIKTPSTKQEESIMEGEIKNLIIVWISAFASLAYCHLITKITPKSLSRLLAILPTICLLLILPLNLHSMVLSGFTIFFLVCLTNLKLLLFAFHKGPLSPHPSLNLPHFIAIACFPIKIQQQNQQNPKPPRLSILKLASLCLLLAAFVPIYTSKQHVHPTIMLFLYSITMYVMLELYLNVVRDLVRFFIGVELEPQFNNPFFATSLQDFWGRRWNVMVSDILHPAVYVPVRSVSSRLIGGKLAKYPAILATFLVSGLLHEVQLYYYGREKPRWDVTCFFLLHGLCVGVEIALKSKLRGKYPRGLPRWVAAPLVAVFAVATASLFFIPALLRNGIDVKTRNEFIAFYEFLKEALNF